MNPPQLHPDLLAKLEDRTVIYADRIHILIELDKSNWGILSVSKLKKTKHSSSAIIGCYPPGEGALVELVKLRARSDLLDEVRKKGIFRDLDLLIGKYLRSIKKASHAVVGESFRYEKEGTSLGLSEQE